LLSGRPLSGDISEGPVVADSGVSRYISMAQCTIVDTTLGYKLPAQFMHDWIATQQERQTAA